MTKFNIGDKVVVTSLTSSEEAVGVDSDVMAVGKTVVITSERDTGGTYCMDDSCWYHEDDLELIDENKSTTNKDGISEGDTVSIVTLHHTREMFGVGDLEVGMQFKVTYVDHEDDSIKSNTGEWCSIHDVVLVEDNEDNVEPTNDRVEDDTVYLITRDTVTLSINGNSEVITKDCSNFETVRELVLKGEFDQAMSLMNVGLSITSWGQGSLQINEGSVYYVGMELTGKLVDRIIDLMGQGDEDFERFAKFLNLTMEQESFKTRERLMDFAAHDKLDINNDGHVVAFKNVRNDYYDKHSGTFRNMVGDTPSMRRSDVDDDHDRACSQGLHVCSPTYLKGFWGTSGKTMRVVVDPRDFVAIPYDYNDSKARVCKYTVVEDVTDKINEYL